jgi:hypothetical protein
VRCKYHSRKINHSSSNSFSLSIKILTFWPEIFLIRGNTSVTANQDDSQLIKQQSSEQVQPSPYDLSNIPSSLDPLFNLSSVIGNIGSGSGSSGSASSTSLQSIMPPVLGPIPPSPVTG